MRRTIAALLCCIPALAMGAGPSAEGRWEGRIEIPGRALTVVVDLAQDKAGAWAGSIIVPGLGIKGAPLSNVVATATDLSFDAGGPLATPTGPAHFKARLDAGALAGELNQGGNEAKFSLRKTGPAQVENPPRSTAVASALEDSWSGEFELGGYPRHVTITLENHSGGAATAKFVAVGKRTTDLPVDLVVQEGKLLRIESQAYRVAFEGRLAEQNDEIRGTIEVGAFEVPLVLRRAGRTS